MAFGIAPRYPLVDRIFRYCTGIHRLSRRPGIELKEKFVLIVKAIGIYVDISTPSPAKC